MRVKVNTYEKKTAYTVLLFKTFKNLDCTNNLARAKATRAYIYSFVGAVYNSLYSSDVWFPSSVSFTV